MRQILYSVARSVSGELIRAADGEKGEAYFCGYCKDPLILRKSGKTGIGRKRPHFAHKALSPNCSPESALHFEFKTMLADEIQRRLAEQTALAISWKCTYCYGEHAGNLLKKTRRVALEHSLGECRPDLVLFDEQNRVIAAIEVVVTHAPEQAAKEYYRSNRITLVELRLDSEDVLNDVVAKLAKADRVQLCPDRQRCHKCGHFQQPVVMKIIEAPCYNCNSKMKVPFIEGDYSRGSHIGPASFTRTELDIARNHGTLIEWQYSRTLNTKYWAVTCGRCRRFVGDHYLVTDYVVPAYYGESRMTSIPLANFCEYCAQAEAELTVYSD